MLATAVIHSRPPVKAMNSSLKTNQKQMLIRIFLNTPHLLTHGKLLPFKMLSSPSEYQVAVKTGAASCHTQGAHNRRERACGLVCPPPTPTPSPTLSWSAYLTSRLCYYPRRYQLSTLRLRLPL